MLVSDIVREIEKEVGSYLNKFSKGQEGIREIRESFVKAKEALPA